MGMFSCCDTFSLGARDGVFFLFSPYRTRFSYRHVEEDDQPGELDTANDDGEQVCRVPFKCLGLS